jgi:hypothetical protein
MSYRHEEYLTHAEEAGLPLADTRIADPVLATQVRDRDPSLVLLQDPDDLRFREAAAPHVLVLSIGQNELQAGLTQTGNVRLANGGRVKPSAATA